MNDVPSSFSSNAGRCASAVRLLLSQTQVATPLWCEGHRLCIGKTGSHRVVVAVRALSEFLLLNDTQIAVLIAHAARVREAAYAPYSRYRVGAAVVAEDERVFFGCNVENASYGLSLCAERAAMAAAVAGGWCV